MNDAPTIGERYGRAMKSANLKLEVEPGDVDILIAAGLVRETLATRLIRLRAEFDQVRKADTGVTIAKPGVPRVVVPMLVSWPEARRFLREWAVNEGGMRRLEQREAEEIADRTLDLFLDPNCPACEGRGFSGGYGLPSLRCPACRETGRRQAFWRTDAEEAFARWLQAQLEAKIDRALGEMRRLLRQRGA